MKLLIAACLKHSRGFICSCVQQKLTSFSLTRRLVQNLIIPAFEQGKLFVCTRGPMAKRAPKFLSAALTASKENWTRNCALRRCKKNLSSFKLVKENLRRKTCSLYTRASKATKEVVKKNLVKENLMWL